MISLRKAVLVISVLAVLAPIMASGIEYRPGEKAAEDLFNMGIGKPWISGEPFESSFPANSWQSFTVRPYSSYRIIGYLNVGNSFGLVGDTGNSLQFLPGPGSYPVYGYLSGGRLTGIFIDLSNSQRTAQMGSSL
ncbi:MAG: hypothetical protein A4E48_02501 [Methanosaeta sp. PtaU1.Bin060]|nr:MAG: hypothetical protein A4E48_02501 [Methanosaeta sp. PtaU1.Bin060]